MATATATATTPTAAATSDFPAFISRLYAQWTLDCLVEIGYAVSVDLVARPQLYLTDDIPDGIVQFRVSYGTDPQFPNTAQRQAMMLPVFGRSDGLKPDATTASAPFHMARKKFIDACMAFSERAVDSGVAMLEERVRSAVVPLRAHFQALQGKSVRLSGNQIKAISDAAVGILVAPGVAKVFSVSAPDPKWPFESDDPNGAKLVEIASSTLPVSADCKLAYTKFILLQRVAAEGARTLPLVLTTNVSDEKQLLALISQAYTWGTSLRDFQQLA
jgi:hypothetical protein